MKTLLSTLIVAVSLFLPMTELQAADKPLEITWSNLTVNIEFEDPFEKLKHDQLIDLSIIARIDRLLKDTPFKVNDEMKKEAADARKKLEEQKVDIEGLFAKRDEIIELRKKRATAVNKDIIDKVVKMPGYALPLEYDGKKITEFLLVPWVGACIHTPPPPPNQIISVTSAEPFEVKSRYEPVIIEGVLKGEEIFKDLFLVDGTAAIMTSYKMDKVKVEKFKPADE